MNLNRRTLVSALAAAPLLMPAAARATQPVPPLGEDGLHKPDWLHETFRDLRGPLPEGVTLASRPFVTPTFILIGPDGVEMERLIGFPGQDFFWSYLNEMIDRARDSLSG